LFSTYLERTGLDDEEMQAALDELKSQELKYRNTGFAPGTQLAVVTGASGKAPAIKKTKAAPAATKKRKLAPVSSSSSKPAVDVRAKRSSSGRRVQAPKFLSFNHHNDAHASMLFYSNS
jgi:hypothetical protein